MKHTLIACVLAMAGGFSAVGFAGQHKDADSMHERRMEHMTQELDLNSDQQEQISTINREYAKRYRELSQAQRDEVGHLLNEEQQAKMQTMRDERRNKMAKNRARHGDEQRAKHSDSDD